jgi:hypothetical protein
MPLTHIICWGTLVSTLSPLKQQSKLTYLHISGTRVSDLSPLQGKKLEGLIFRGTQVSDVSVIKDMPLTGIGIDFKPERDTELLRSIKTLQTINDKNVAEFWKEAGIE